METYRKGKGDLGDSCGTPGMTFRFTTVLQFDCLELHKQSQTCLSQQYL